MSNALTQLRQRELILAQQQPILANLNPEQARQQSMRDLYKTDLEALVKQIKPMADEVMHMVTNGVDLKWYEQKMALLHKADAFIGEVDVIVKDIRAFSKTLTPAKPKAKAAPSNQA